MRRVCFVLSKNPAEFKGGDVRVSRLIMNLAAASFHVEAVALTKSPALVGARAEAYGVVKPAVNFASIGVRTVLRRRSPVHVRFDVPDLRKRLDSVVHDMFVAEHSYMAESILASETARERLWINTHCSEADVARMSSAVTNRITANITLRDEIRVALRARSVGCFDRDELSRYKANGVRNTDLLRITLPPTPEPADITASEASLLFLGDQTWWPNYKAVVRLLDIWPHIRSRVPNATLNIVGRGDPRMRWHSIDGVKHWGFVDDLTPFLRRSRAMVAPIKTGGGIRVKLLEACSNGLPVIASSAAVGSLDELLDLPVYSDDASLIEECVRMLLDSNYAARAGLQAYWCNADFWTECGPQRSVERWLSNA
jgi:glycosyltransferase involved in cell wall biosynthesis